MAAVRTFHVNPSTSQAIRMVCTISNSGGIQDMRSVVSSVIVVATVDGESPRTYQATITSKTRDRLVLIHQFAEGEFSDGGDFSTWPMHNVEGRTPIQGAVYQFRLVPKHIPIP